MPKGEVKIPAYPAEPAQPTRMSPLLTIAPVSGILFISIGYGIVYGNFTYAGIMVTVSLIYASVMLLRQRDQRLRYESERDRVMGAFEERIDQVQVELDRLRSGQQAHLRHIYPAPAALVKWPGSRSSRLWERRVDDADFLHLRVGTGEVPSSYTVKLPEIEIPELEPEPLIRAKERAADYQRVADVPLAFDLKGNGSLGISGPRPRREASARAMIAGSAALHAPQDLSIYAIAPANRASDWNWLKWLPHTHAIDSSGETLQLAYERDRISQVLARILDELEARALRETHGHGAPFLLLLVADPDLVTGEVAVQRILESGPELGAGVVILSPSPSELPHECRGRLELRDKERAAYVADRGAREHPVVPDRLSLAETETLARGLAPLDLADAETARDLPESIRLLDLLDAPMIEGIDLQTNWLEALGRPPDLVTPLGVRHGSRHLLLDLRQSGQGPHGLIAGTTGSGKSELLLTLLTGLAINTHPHQVNFVLVDYKGGTAMSVLKDLPHTVGVVTDLDGKQTRRALIALRRELTRREEILAIHQVADIDKYHELGIAEPFPYLFIVIDEFAELRERFKDDLGEILSEFVSIAQKGRALGVHLILAMQRPEGVVNEAIRANMRFKICLRVERAEDSRNVLGRPDAYLLPSRPPGRAYFQVGKDEQFDLFQVARIAGYPAVASRNGRALSIQEVAPDGRRIPLLEVKAPPRQARPKGWEAQTEAQILVARAAEAAAAMGLERLSSPWPPALPEQLPLAELLRQSGPQAWTGGEWPEVGPEPAPGPVALLDEPTRQRQRPLYVELGQEGNYLAVGSPGSGRTTFILTLVTSLALVNPPDRVHFHVIDYAGHQLRAAFRDFPHVAGSYGPEAPDRIRRLLTTLQVELRTRRALFESAGTVGLAGYNRAKGMLPAIVVCVNSFSGFREAFPDDLTAWTTLVREGAAYGMHFVLTSDRHPPGQIGDLIHNRIALKMADRLGYALILDVRPDLRTFDPVPGRGFYNTRPPHELQIALPTPDAPDEQIPALQRLGERMAAVWEGPLPSPVEVLGDAIALGEVLEQGASIPRRTESAVATWIGRDEADLQPLTFNLSDVGPYVLLAGPPESGKTTALATLALGLAARHGADRLRMAVITPRRVESYRLDELTRLNQTIAQAKTEPTVVRLLDELEALDHEPHIHTLLLIDDYHLLPGRLDQGTMQRLEQLAAAGSDSNLTTVAAVPSTVLGTLNDPLIRQMKSWRTGIWLQSTDGLEASMVGVRLPLELRSRKLPPGRGFLYDPGGQIYMQLATPELATGDGPGTLLDWVIQLRG